MDPWIMFFKTIMDKQLPAELDDITEDMDIIAERDKHICWKTKGVAS